MQLNLTTSDFLYSSLQFYSENLILLTCGSRTKIKQRNVVLVAISFHPANSSNTIKRVVYFFIHGSLLKTSWLLAERLRYRSRDQKVPISMLTLASVLTSQY